MARGQPRSHCVHLLGHLKEHTKHSLGCVEAVVQVFETLLWNSPSLTSLVSSAVKEYFSFQKVWMQEADDLLQKDYTAQAHQIYSGCRAASSMAP